MTTDWLKQQIFISHSSGGWKSKVMVSVDSVPGERLLPGKQNTLWGLFHKHTNPTLEASSS